MFEELRDHFDTLTDWQLLSLGDDLPFDPVMELEVLDDLLIAEAELEFHGE